ncbi:EAL domain-containing protein (plasmid) [Paroceanicella profunda]|uniref:EAL domain-containing protein n=1 Tax=Paroceanicella profunda TaxID=2579971 RepID=A0A5B8FYT4_9RHOB|nr:GGDEF domain-containing phosphodiesterase [Paroceanicella profunda]QDL94066.1 EAL domain-containing protein [Paroceanicella profunda]
MPREHAPRPAAPPGLTGLFDDHSAHLPEQDAPERVIRLAQLALDVPFACLARCEPDGSAPRVLLRTGLPDEGMPEAGTLGVLARAGGACALPAGVDSGLAFVAGAPVRDVAGRLLGCLCVAGPGVRPALPASHLALLTELAALSAEGLSKLTADAPRAVPGDAVLCADAANRILDWNAAAERMFGYTAAEALGQPLDLIIPPRLQERHRHGLDRSADSAAPRHYPPLQTLARHRDGRELPIEITISSWETAGLRLFGALIRELHTSDCESPSPGRDTLTGLEDRAALRARLGRAGEAGRPALMLLVDIDGFKDVNTMRGHRVGDHVLRVVARRLLEQVGGQGSVSRLGSDEFAICLEGGEADLRTAAALADTLIAAVRAPIPCGEAVLHVGANVGIAATVPGSLPDPDVVIGNADLALLRAKASGANIARVFTEDLRQTARRRSAISSGLRRAWERGEFELFYQPQVRLRDGEITGAEALIRWNHPEQGLLSPAAFIAVLEADSLAIPVGEWVLRTACGQAATWRAATGRNLRIGVNVFASQFNARGFVATVDRALSDSGLPPEALELEITEKVMLHSDAALTAPLQYLRTRGVGIAFDDFGTGFASFSMLKHYPASRLKIDRSFVGSGESPHDLAIIEAVTRLAAGFNLGVIAEGVETAEQAGRMRRQACEEGQGFLFGQPMPAAAFAALLEMPGRGPGGTRH